jgi:hypothetical protein
VPITFLDSSRLSDIVFLTCSRLVCDRTLMRLCCVTSHSTIFQLYRGVLLVEKIGIPEEIYRPAISYWQTLSHNVVLSTPWHEQDSNSQLLWW